MKAAPLPPKEAERLRLLKHLELLDVESEEIFDALTRIISMTCDVPIAVVSLIESCRQWFRPRKPPADRVAQRNLSFCEKAIERDEILIIRDATDDDRFRDNSLVREEPCIRFLACFPLKLDSNVRLGSLCLIDYQPRTLNEHQLELLRLLVEQAALLLKLRLSKVEANLEFSTLTAYKHKLQYQKEMMEAILDNEPEGVAIVSPDGKLGQLNAAAMAMLEVTTQAETHAHRFVDFILPDFRERFYLTLSRLLTGEHLVTECRIRGKKGTERWMESHAAPLHDQAGNIASLIFVMRDVTEIKESRKRLEQAARVFSDAQEGIIITDPTTTIIDVNPAFCAITGYTREEIIGQTPRVLHSGIQSADVYSLMWNTLSKTGHWKGELWNRKKNGELYAELISISALRDERGKVINYVGMFLDITEIKYQQGLLSGDTDSP